MEFMNAGIFPGCKIWFLILR